MDVVTPGQFLGSTDEFTTGSGVFVRHGQIYASGLGKRTVLQATDAESKPKVSITYKKDSPGVPDVDSIIIGKVIRVNPRFATVAILVVNDLPCREEFQGIIRSQDVRATEKDKVKIYTSFRPGDTIRAQVISLGDMKSYYLSTARNDLGVLFADSVAAGVTMVPISWKEMMCPKTQTIEYRKVAKPADV